MGQDNKRPQWNTPTPADRRVFPPEAVFEAGLRHHHIANTAYPIHGLGSGAQSLSHHTLSYNLGAAAKALNPSPAHIYASRPWGPNTLARSWPCSRQGQ